MSPIFLTALLTLPLVPIDTNWTKCTQALDCAIAGDGCRSCTQQVSINRQYLEDYNQRDQTLRKKAGVVRACEACSTQHLKMICQKGTCQIVKP